MKERVRLACCYCGSIGVVQWAESGDRLEIARPVFGALSCIAPIAALLIGSSHPAGADESDSCESFAVRCSCAKSEYQPQRGLRGMYTVVSNNALHDNGGCKFSGNCISDQCLVLEVQVASIPCTSHIETSSRCRRCGAYSLLEV